MKHLLFYTATFLTVSLALQDSVGLPQKKALELAAIAPAAAAAVGNAKPNAAAAAPATPIAAVSKTLTLLNSTNAAALYAN